MKFKNHPNVTIEQNNQFSVMNIIEDGKYFVFRTLDLNDLIGKWSSENNNNNTMVKGGVGATLRVKN